MRLRCSGIQYDWPALSVSRAAIRYAQRLLGHDELHEATYRWLMRLHALNGDRAHALRGWRACATVLQRELGAEPSPTTREAYERLVSHGTETATRVESSSPLAVALPLVGRDDEWQQLQAAWRRASRGRPRLVLVAGEAGIGKTRLAERVAPSRWPAVPANEKAAGSWPPAAIG